MENEVIRLTRVLFFISLLLSTQNVYCEFEHGYKDSGFGKKGTIVHLGLKGGTTLARATVDDFTSQRKWGYQFGGYISIDLMPAFGIQGEVLYTRNRLEIPRQEIPAKGKTTLRNWEFPVLLRLNAGETFTINLGPQFSHVISPKGYEVNVNDDFFKRVSYVLGVELGSERSGGKVYLRYNWNKRDYEHIAQNKITKISQFQFGITISFM